MMMQAAGKKRQGVNQQGRNVGCRSLRHENAAKLAMGRVVLPSHTQSKRVLLRGQVAELAMRQILFERRQERFEVIWQPILKTSRQNKARRPPGILLANRTLAQERALTRSLQAERHFVS